MGWNFVEAFPEDFFDVIIASPPCTEYSAAMTCRARDLEMADQNVQMTIDIINHFQPRHWFIENPKTGLLKGRPFMKEYAYVDVDYCQFSSWGYQKPTRIWGPAYLRNLKSRICDQKTCTNIIVRSSGHSGHRRVLGATPQDGAPRISLEDQYRIPEGLIYYIMGWEIVDTKNPRMEIPMSTRQHGCQPGITTPGDSDVVEFVP